MTMNTRLEGILDNRPLSEVLKYKETYYKDLHTTEKVRVDERIQILQTTTKEDAPKPKENISSAVQGLGIPTSNSVGNRDLEKANLKITSLTLENKTLKHNCEMYTIDIKQLEHEILSMKKLITKYENEDADNELWMMKKDNTIESLRNQNAKLKNRIDAAQRKSKQNEPEFEV